MIIRLSLFSLPPAHIALPCKRLTHSCPHFGSARNDDNYHQRILMAFPRSTEYAQILKEFTEANAGSSLEKATEFLDNKLPDEDDRYKFHRWVESRRSPPPELVTPDAVISQIKSTNFATTECNQLVALLNTQSPYIPIGIIDGFSFRLSPNPFYLQSEYDNHNNLRERIDDPDDYSPMGFRHSILSVPSSALRTPVGSSQSTKHKRDANTHSSDISSKTPNAKSPDQGSALTFFQLGMLEYYVGEGQAFEDTRHWSTTDFAVGVEITNNFKAGAIYLIYNFRQEHDDGYTLRVDKGGNDEEWGYLTVDSEDTISCAKIAESVDRFGKGRQLKLDVKSSSPFDLTHTEWESRMKTCALEGTQQSGSRKIAHANTNGDGLDISKLALNSGSVTVGR